MTNLEKYNEAFTTTFEITEDQLAGLKYQDIEAWDSVGHMSLIAALEDAFDIMMDTDDIIDLSSYEKGKEILSKADYGVRDEFGRQLTYTDLNTEANRLAEKVGRRCLVFSLCRNEIGSLIGYIGFVNNGIVSVQLSSHLDDSLLQNLLATYQPAFIWTPKDQTE